MKQVIVLLSVLLLTLACGKSADTSPFCGTHNGKQLYKGSEGGCYYVNSNGNKEYVDASECKC